MTQSTPTPKSMTLQEALKEAGSGPSLEFLQANYRQIVEEVEAEAGPQILGRLTGRGRPAKGVQVEPAVPHSIRVKPSIWAALTTKAQEAGLTPNAAAQLALLEWAKH